MYKNFKKSYLIDIFEMTKRKKMIVISFIVEYGLPKWQIGYLIKAIDSECCRN